MMIWWIIWSLAIVVMLVYIGIVSRKNKLYKNDERGHAIMAKASTWLPSAAFSYFALSTLITAFIAIAGPVARTVQCFMAGMVIVMCLTHLVGIFYFEKKMS